MKRVGESLGVAEAAQLLGMSAAMLRSWLKNGNCPFGYALRLGGSRHYTYILNTVALNKWLVEGVKPNQ